MRWFVPQWRASLIGRWLCLLVCHPADGDLRKLLRGCQSKNIKLTSAEQLTLVAPVASGFAYMEDHRYVHMDIAARNCLVGAHNNVKIADFGMSRKLEENEDHWTGPASLKIPVKWCAPEVISEKMFSHASDVWSYGIMVWEVMAYGEMPMKGINNVAVSQSLQKGYRCPAPPGCNAETYEQLKKMWSYERAERPTFEEVHSNLMAILRKMPEKRDVRLQSPHPPCVSVQCFAKATAATAIPTPGRFC